MSLTLVLPPGGVPGPVLPAPSLLLGRWPRPCPWSNGRIPRLCCYTCRMSCRCCNWSCIHTCYRHYMIYCIYILIIEWTMVSIMYYGYLKLSHKFHFCCQVFFWWVCSGCNVSYGRHVLLSVQPCKPEMHLGWNWFGLVSVQLCWKYVQTRGHEHALKIGKW